MWFLASVFLLWAVPVHASAGSISAGRAPSECEELRHENGRLRELLEQLSARCPEPIETEPQSAARLGEDRRAIRALLGTADAAVVSASAAVVEGEANTNECPTGTAAMSSEEECSRGAGILGIEFWDSGLEPQFPTACYGYAGVAYFNTHPVGSSCPEARPICYVRTSTPTPAPTRSGDTISPTVGGAVCVFRPVCHRGGAQHRHSVVCADDRCNGTLRMALSSEPVRLTDGVGWYASNMRCEWQLSGGGTIELVVSVMDVEYGADELRVYDGPNSSSPLIALGDVRGSLPEPIRSSGGSMTVVFTSDGAYQREGFVGTVRLLPASTPTLAAVGYTWAPTTAATAGPPACT